MRAVEEAKEVLDRRAGITPETSHHPVDFLDPSTYPSSSNSDSEGGAQPDLAKADLRPQPLEREAARDIDSRKALEHLLAVARGESSEVSLPSCRWC